MKRAGIFDRTPWHRTRWLALVAVALVVLVAAGCGGKKDSSGGGGDTTASKDPIVIGSAVALTGGLSAFDLPALQGTQIAIDEINKSGGILGRPVKLVKADTKSDINQGARAGQEVLAKGADAMIVTLDFNYGGGAAREAQKASKVVIAPGAGSPEFGVQGIGSMAYTLGIAAQTDSVVAAEWGIEDKKFKTAYLLLDDITDYDKTQCKSFKTAWTDAGGTILGEDTFKNSDPSVAAQVTRIKSLSSEPDLIMLCSFPPGGAVAVKQLRDAGVKSAIISNGAMDGDYWYKQSVPNLSDFYITASASVWGDDPSQQVNDFVAKVKAKSGQPQAYFTVLGYIAVYAIKEAMEKANSTDGTAVAAELDKFNKEPVGGLELTFTPELHIDTKREERVIGVFNGKHKTVASRAAEKQLPL
ncbi:MAG: branched-chain amino acid transport system substrate-binding protein, partial [Acidimicrobiaceae bacterium]